MSLISETTDRTRTERSPAEAASISRSFLGTAAWNLAGRGAFLVSGFLGTVILARTLPAGTYGLYALLVVLHSYVVIVCDLGLSNALLRFAAQGGDAARRWQLFRFSALVQCSIALVLVLLAHWGRPLMERAYRVDFGPFLILVVALALLTTLRNDLQNLRIAAGRGSAIMGANLSFATLWVGGLVLLTVFGMSLASVLLLQIFALGAAVTWLFAGLRPPAGSQGRPDGAVGEQREVLTYSLAFVVRGLVTAIVQKQSEVVFLGYFLTLAAVGHYDIGYSFSFFALMSIHQALYPVAVATLSRAAKDGEAKLRRAITMYYKVIFVHAIPIAAIGAVFGDRLVEVLYGPEMAPAGPIARVFFLVNLLPFLPGGLAVGMLALGRPWAGMHLSIATALLNLGLAAALIPSRGVSGAIAAVTATGLMSGAAFLLYYRRYLGNGIVPWVYLVRCILAATPIALLLALRPWVDGVVSLAASLLLAGVLYLAGARMWGLIRDEERRLLDSSGFPLARRLGQLLGR